MFLSNQIGLDKVIEAYQCLFKILALRFSAWGSERIQDVELWELIRRYKLQNLDGQMSSTKTASLASREAENADGHPGCIQVDGLHHLAVANASGGQDGVRADDLGSEDSQDVANLFFLVM